MRLLLLCLTLAVVTALTACGKSDEEKADDAANDGQVQIQALNSERMTLAAEYGIVVKGDSDFVDSKVLHDLTPSQLRDARDQLNSLIAHGVQAQNDTGTYGDYDVETSDPAGLQNAINSAQQWVTMINARLQKLGVTS